VEPTLRNITIFAGLDESALSLLMSRVRRTTAPADGVIVREGEPGNQLYLIASGSVRICKRFGRPDQLELARLGPGDFFGEMTLIEMQNRSATVVAETETTLYELTARNLYSYYKADIPAYLMVLQNINRELCRRLRRADDRIAELADASREQ
jgi:CRP-like cAMP-binding protein